MVAGGGADTSDTAASAVTHDVSGDERSDVNASPVTAGEVTHVIETLCAVADYFNVE